MVKLRLSIEDDSLSEDNTFEATGIVPVPEYLDVYLPGKLLTDLRLMYLELWSVCYRLLDEVSEAWVKARGN